jgi:hypothetical protein
MGTRAYFTLRTDIPAFHIVVQALEWAVLKTFDCVSASTTCTATPHAPRLTVGGLPALEQVPARDAGPFDAPLQPKQPEVLR